MGRKGIKYKLPVIKCHGDVMYNIGNIVDTMVITIYGDRRLLGLLWCLLHKIYKC